MNTSADSQNPGFHRNFQSHWDKVYSEKEIDTLGWYEDIPEPSLSLIEQTGITSDARQLHVGVGSSTLIDHLLVKGYQGIIASDLSDIAMETLRARIGAKAGDVQWIVDDLSRPEKLQDIAPIDLWHDRAVLHFLTKEEEQNAYFDLVRKLVKPGGFAIIAVFNLAGAEKCSGLPVHRYDEQMLMKKMGPDFELKEAFDHTYMNPSGQAREYVYTVFKRKDESRSIA